MRRDRAASGQLALSHELSLGNKQRLALARALLNAPEVLVLDEAANALDPAGIVEVRGLLRRLADERGVTVFISSYILAEVAHLADRVGIVHAGRLVEELYDGLAGRLADVVAVEGVLADEPGLDHVDEVHEGGALVGGCVERGGDLAAGD